jgi:hypothetical protein
MLHLSTDRLAELGDATPTPAEAEHLAACEACAQEQGAYVALVALAADARGSLALPLTRWEGIAAGLSPAAPLDVASAARRPLRVSRWTSQAAAGLLLLAGGAVVGRVSAGATPLPDRAGVVARASSDAVAAATRLLGDSGSFGSVEEARAAQARSELVYEQASTFLAQHDSTDGSGSPVAYRSRLAALDRVISTTREALREVPHDPVINQYYLTTIGQREATLRQLDSSQPSSLRLTSF